MHQIYIDFLILKILSGPYDCSVRLTKKISPKKNWDQSDNFKRCHGGNIFLVITIITSFSQNARIFMFDSSKNPQKNTDYRKNNAGAVRQKLWVLCPNNRKINNHKIGYLEVIWA